MASRAGDALPDRPPFAFRCRLLTPLAAGGTRFEQDAVVSVDGGGRIDAVVSWSDRASDDDRAAGAPMVDLRPWVLMPGLVDLHVHLPQLPAAALGAGLDLLTWLERYIFPLERAFDEEAAERLAPEAFREMARAGTTTAVVYGAIWEPSIDASFRAAEAHGIRAVIGKVMMDEVTYDERLPRERILEVSLRQSADLCSRWHGRDEGRLSYAFTPRFAVSCSAEMLRESAALARSTGAYWQSHLSEDRREIEEVARRVPDAIDYLDVYDRAGALGERTILAHAVHLSERELDRLVETGSRVAHCPASNLFLASGVMPLARYLERGAVVGLGSDLAGGPELSILAQMRAGADSQSALRSLTGDQRAVLDPLGWLRLGTYEGARALGLQETIGSVEPGKDADVIVVDPSHTHPVSRAATSDGATEDATDLVSRLIYRTRPDMVRGTWVRGRLLPA